MRRLVIVGGVVVMVCATAALASVVWVDRALAAVSPEVLCLTANDRDRITTGNYPLRHQDLLVGKAINFDQGVTRMTWWHLRGAAIHITYVTFWSPSSRANEFRRVVTRMKDCPPQRG